MKNKTERFGSIATMVLLITAGVVINALAALVSFRIRVEQGE